jgi:hypothetical protein
MTEAEQTIRERAHRLWEEAGCPEGRDAEFWERAQREIEGESGQTDRRVPRK